MREDRNPIETAEPSLPRPEGRGSREGGVGDMRPARVGPAWLIEPASGQRYYLAAPLTMIGRSAPSHVALGADPYLSRRHAAIHVQDEEFWFLDLSSANGSFINQRPAVGPQRLRAGDAIRIGMTSLVFEVAPSEDSDG